MKAPTRMRLLLGTSMIGLLGYAASSGVIHPLQEEAKPEVYALVRAGDSVRVKLLAGVNAPIEDTPYPVVMKLLGNIDGPDGSSISLAEARIIGATNVSLIDQRVHFRLTRMVYKLPSGEARAVDVDGWLVDDEGIRGLEGHMLFDFPRCATRRLSITRYCERSCGWKPFIEILERSPNRRCSSINIRGGREGTVVFSKSFTINSLVNPHP